MRTKQSRDKHCFLNHFFFMKTLNTSVSACHYCRHYVPMGQRGGYCQVLGATVKGEWKACSLAKHPFGSSRQPQPAMFDTSLPKAS
jgi:hypothetical protein